MRVSGTGQSRSDERRADPNVVVGAEGGLAGFAVGVLVVLVATWVRAALPAPILATAIIAMAAALGASLSSLGSTRRPAHRHRH